MILVTRKERTPTTHIKNVCHDWEKSESGISRELQCEGCNALHKRSDSVSRQLMILKEIRHKKREKSKNIFVYLFLISRYQVEASKEGQQDRGVLNGMRWHFQQHLIQTRV